MSLVTGKKHAVTRNGAMDNGPWIQGVLVLVWRSSVVVGVLGSAPVPSGGTVSHIWEMGSSGDGHKVTQMGRSHRRVSGLIGGPFLVPTRVPTYTQVFSSSLCLRLSQPGKLRGGNTRLVCAGVGVMLHFPDLYKVGRGGAGAPGIFIVRRSVRRSVPHRYHVAEKGYFMGL
jgi:hypothetical protein